MTEAQENYLKLLNSVYDVYKDHTQIHLTDAGKELYFHAHDRYGGCSYITLTEEQVVEMARGASNRLQASIQSIECYLDDYDYLKKESRETPEPT